MGEIPRAARATMSLWEYKVISSGKGGFATPVLLEKFLNDLGRDEWEIIDFRTQPDNALAFSGLARRPTQRDWTLQDAAAAAAKVEAEKLRAEFEAKFKAGTTTVVGAEESAPSFLEEKAAPEDGFRKPVDTSHDSDPDAVEDEKDDWDKLTAAEEDELPTFFEAIKPHMRRNQRGPGMSVGADYLAKKWDQSEDDLKGALVECGFVLPADEDAAPVHIEYDGDLYWLNINRRGELWINTKEKPRPMFRPVKAVRVTVEEEAKPEGQRSEERNQRPDDRGRKTEEGGPRPETRAPEATEPTAAVERSAPAGERAPSKSPLPEGAALLARIRPHMRRNRRGPGGSGSTSFLSRALKCSEADLKAAFETMGLTVPAGSGDKPVFVEIGDELWWLNADSRGGLWINGREKKAGETALSAAASEAEAPAPTSAVAAPTEGNAAVVVAPQPATAVSPEPSPQPAGTNVLSAVRLLLKETKTGGFAGKAERLAGELGKPVEEFVATLVGAGLKVPEKAREKPVFVEQAAEIFWLNKNAKGELWVNAKASKFADKNEAEGGAETPAAGGAEAGQKANRRGGRSRKKSE